MLLSPTAHSTSRRLSAALNSESVAKLRPSLKTDDRDTHVDKHDSVGQTVQSDKVTLQALKNAIPAHCFQPSWAKGLYYVARDTFLVYVFGYAAWNYIPLIPSTPLRWLAWNFYGYMQGLVFMGLWTIAHEMGHGSQLPSRLACDIFGFLIHTFELIPYYGFKSVHAKHHRYTGHIEKDPDHVPPYLEFEKDENAQVSSQEESTETKTQTHAAPSGLFARIGELIEDAPLNALFWVLFQQLLGWPLYLIISISAGPSSAEYKHNSLTKRMPEWLRKSKVNPFGSFFRNDEMFALVSSDLAVLGMTIGLGIFAKTYGFGTLCLLYGLPWLWLNHWLVIITLLQHTHPEVPKFDNDSWTYMKGATATVDRDYGFAGRFFMHNIIPNHVVHHIFPRMPFYHAIEATEAMKPVLGDLYHYESKNYWASIWRECTTCHYVVADTTKDPKERALWFLDVSSKVPTSAEFAKQGMKKKAGGEWRWKCARQLSVRVSRKKVQEVAVLESSSGYDDSLPFLRLLGIDIMYCGPSFIA